MTANDIGKIERGQVSLPRGPRRAAFRKALRAESDAEIGFFEEHSPRLTPVTDEEIEHVKRKALQHVVAQKEETQGQIELRQEISESMSTRAAPTPRRKELPVDLDTRAWNLPPDDETLYRQSPLRTLEVETGIISFASSTYDAVSSIRRQINVSLETAYISDSTVEHWRVIAEGYGRDYRASAPMAFLSRIAQDLAELTAILGQRIAPKQRRALCKCTAHMAGLLATTFVNLNDFREARAWFDTANRAAEQSEDPTLEAWVMVRHAVSALYWNDPYGALDLTSRAIEMTNNVDCVAAAWAPAVQARAHSRLGPGHRDSVRDSITRAEKAFAQNSASSGEQHAYGYTAAQLHFYRSNALTEIGETEEAYAAQKAALAHYGPAAFLDPSLIRLDRAICPAKDDKSEAAAKFALESIRLLPREHISPILVRRARELTLAIPSHHRHLAAVRAFEEAVSSQITSVVASIGMAR